METSDDCEDSCCGPPGGCVFAKALLARRCDCRLARRQTFGEHEVWVCGSAVAHGDCERLLGQVRERVRFALRLPRPGAPLMHARALQLQAGGLAGLQQALGQDADDVHELVAQVLALLDQELDFPWPEVVAVTAGWSARPTRGPRLR